MEKIFLWFVGYRFYFMGALILIVLIDLIWDRSRQKRLDSSETFLNLGIFTIGLIFHAVLIVDLPWRGMVWSSRFQYFRFEDSWSSFLICLLLADFCYYFWHRCSHSIPILWADHHIHHSSKELNISTALRLPWFNNLVIWFFFAPLILVGFSPEMVFFSMAIVITGQFFIHHPTFPSLGVWEKFINGPSSHRIHHAVNSVYINRNFGGITNVWDRLFGTFVHETEAPVYALEGGSHYRTPWAVNFMPLRDLFLKAIARKSFLVFFVREK